MQFFGLIGLLITFALGVWWITSMGPFAPSSGNETTNYEESINAAQEAADQLGGTTVQAQRVIIYNGISVAKDSETVDISGRNLSGSLKAEIRELQSLRVLDISKNDFTGVPAEVGQLKNLEILNLSNNPITGLPHEIGNLLNLKVLDLQNTEYSQTDLDVIRAQLPKEVVIRL